MPSQAQVFDRINQETYRREAARYDRSRFGSRRGRFAKQVKNEIVLDVLARHDLLRPAVRILDVATGTGRIAHDLARTGLDRVYGADLTREMLLRNASGIAPDVHSKLSLLQADMKRLAFRAESFHAITLGSFFYLIPQREYATFTRDLHRILRPGGLLICEIANAWTLFNPVNFARIARHKFIRRRRVKSYVSPLRVRRSFPGFDLEESYGVEFPLVGSSFAFYRGMNRCLGRLPLARWTGGKFIAVLRKA